MSEDFADAFAFCPQHGQQDADADACPVCASTLVLYRRVQTRTLDTIDDIADELGRRCAKFMLVFDLVATEPDVPSERCYFAPDLIAGAEMLQLGMHAYEEAVAKIDDADTVDEDP